MDNPASRSSLVGNRLLSFVVPRWDLNPHRQPRYRTGPLPLSVQGKLGGAGRVPSTPEPHPFTLRG